MNLLQSPTSRLAAFAALSLFSLLTARAADSAAASPTPAATAALPPLWVPSDGANHPMGVGKGVFPGRVVWIRDLAATPWDGKTGNWWDEGTGISQPAVDNMMSRSLRALVSLIRRRRMGGNLQIPQPHPTGHRHRVCPGRKDRGEDQLQQRLRRLWRCRRAD